MKRMGVIVAVSLVVVLMLLLGCQGNLIYYPRSYSASDLSTVGPTTRQLPYGVPGLGRQVSFYIPPAAGGVPENLWLMTSGNGALALDWEWLPQRYGREVDGFLLIDYPGYGLCEGKPDPSAIRKSIHGAVGAIAAELDVGEGVLVPRLAVLGYSIGAAAGLMAAEDFEVGRVVLVSPFTSMTDMAQRVVGKPLCYLLTHRFDNRARLRAVVDNGARVTMFHGTDDELIPLSMPEELRDLFPGKITLTEIRGAGHNDIISIGQRQIGAAIGGYIGGASTP